ncbi:histidinol-phosphate transaminase [Staphylococcus canis]|uniref:Histidinol-phosphate aminotransferase n=1 Tax=Staphylococcus canis TaxID=2724942 RepID=A0ABS0T5U6_9STAP|nr:histidinol-phosphate transaminase [Staphylococcus canis]MBI5974037.1 histidinol-phosphate transaminase [Staphylococcus canis]
MKSQIKQLKAYQPGLSPEALKKKYHIEGDLHKLASNENVYGPSPKVEKAMSKAVNELYLYPEPNAPELQEAVANHYGVNQNQILFGSGLDEMILIISRALLANDEKMVTSQATFGQYKQNAIIENANIVEVPLKDGFFDLDGILNEIDDQTELVWICNPNNPSGTYHNQQEIEAFLDKVPSRVTVIFDEAYAEYATASDYPDTVALLNKYPNIAMLRTFSKAYALAGLRVGYLIGQPELVEQLNVLRPPFNITRVSEQAAIAAINDQAHLKKAVETNHEEREKFKNLDTSLKIYPSQTNFVFIETDQVQALSDSLLKRGIIARDFPNGIRITLGYPAQNETIREVLAQF